MAAKMQKTMKKMVVESKIRLFILCVIGFNNLLVTKMAQKYSLKKQLIETFITN